MEGAHAIVHELREIKHLLEHGGAPPKKLLAGLGFIEITREVAVHTITQAQPTENQNHGVLLIDNPGLDLSTLGLPVSSDPSVSAASLRADGKGFDLSTPLASGTVHYTFEPPGYDGVEFDFTYQPKPVVVLDAKFGPDEPDV